LPQFFDFDPTTGLKTEFDYDETTGNAIIHTTQDVQASLDYAKASRNDGLRDHGIRENWWHYCTIPPVVMLKLRAEKGLICGKPEHAKRIIEEINTNYPHLKMTQKNHGGKVVEVYDLGKR